MVSNVEWAVSGVSKNRVVPKSSWVKRGIEQTRQATDVEAELARLERGERVEFAKVHPILRALSTG